MTEENKLAGVREIVDSSWQLYKTQWKFLVVIMLPLMIVNLIDKLLTTSFLSVIQKVTQGNILLLTLYFIIGVSLFLVSLSSFAALIYSLNNPDEKNIAVLFKKGSRKIYSLFWLFVLCYLSVIGGSILFLIPGIILYVWFLFDWFIVFSEDLKGMNALMRSRAYVRGYWWILFKKTCALSFLFSLAPSLILSSLKYYPLENSAISAAIVLVVIFFNSLFLIPLSFIAFYKIYQNIRNINPTPTPALRKERFFTWLMFCLGIPILILGLVLIGYSNVHNQKNQVLDNTEAFRNAIYGSNNSDDKKSADFFREMVEISKAEQERKLPSVLQLAQSNLMAVESFETEWSLIQYTVLLQNSIKELESADQVLPVVKEQLLSKISNSEFSESWKQGAIDGLNNSMSLEQSELINKRYAALKAYYKQSLKVYKFLSLNFNNYKIVLDEYSEKKINFKTISLESGYDSLISEVNKNFDLYFQADNDLIQYANKKLQEKNININAEDVRRDFFQ